MSEYKMKSITDLEVITELSNETMVVIEEGGSLKRANSSLIDNGVTHWDDLEGKPFGTETKFEVVAEFNANDGIGGPVKAISKDYADTSGEMLRADVFSIGDTCVVTLDGVEYTGIVTENTGWDANMCPWDVVFSGYAPDVDEAPVQLTTYGGGVYIDFAVKETHTVKIARVKETVTPIPVEYLPAHNHKWEDIENPPFYKHNILLESQTDIEFTSNDYGLFTPLTNKGYRFDDTFKKVTVNLNGYGEQESTNIRSTYSITLDYTTAYIVGNSSLFSDYYLPSSGFSDIPHVDTGENYAIVFICDENDNVTNGLLFITDSFMENPTGFSITATTKKTLHEEFIDSTIPRTPTAEVGQVVRVKAVNERGVPTEWEAADMGGGDFIVKLSRSGDVLTVDKTIDEILQSVTVGKNVKVEEEIGGGIGQVKIYHLYDYATGGFAGKQARFAFLIVTKDAVTNQILMITEYEVTESEHSYPTE